MDWIDQPLAPGHISKITAPAFPQASLRNASRSKSPRRSVGTQMAPVSAVFEGQRAWEEAGLAGCLRSTSRPRLIAVGGIGSTPQC